MPNDPIGAPHAIRITRNRGRFLFEKMSQLPLIAAAISGKSGIQWISGFSCGFSTI